MISIRNFRARCAWLLPAILLLAGPPPVAAQLPSLQDIVSGSGGDTSKPPETQETSRERLEDWIEKARKALADLNGPASTHRIPAKITKTERDRYRVLLEQMTVAAMQSLKDIDDNADAKSNLESARAKSRSWEGFEEPPPYSLLLVDELLNEQEATREKIESYEASFESYGSLIETAINEAKTAEDAVGKLIVELQRSKDSADAAAKWRLETARYKSRLLAVRAGLMKTDSDRLKSRIEASKVELALLDRKLEVSKKSTRLNEEDLQKVADITAEAKEHYAAEAKLASKRLDEAQLTRLEAEKELAKRVSAEAKTGESPEIKLARERLQLEEERVASLQVIVETLNSLTHLESMVVGAYRERWKLVNEEDPQIRAESLEGLTLVSNRLRAWAKVIGNNISGATATLDKVESKLSLTSSEEPVFEVLNEQRKVTSEQLAILHRAAHALTSQYKLIDRWVDENSSARGASGLIRLISSSAVSTWKFLTKIWKFEVMNFEKRMEVQGETVVGRVSVTLGMLLKAILFFYVSYRIARYVIRRIQTRLIESGNIEEAASNTLRNWLMIMVGLVLAICTSLFLNIPITAYAYFGGALAIGLGFGLQTLIKNFISGVILLFERKIRVGDMLELNGMQGTVTEINSRSSIIRSPDNVETLIPNSLFLENSVTNWTLTSANVRCTLNVGVAYGTPPQKVMDVLTESAGRHGLILKEPVPFAIFENFGDSALEFTLRYWVKVGSTTNRLVVASDLRLMIEKRLSEAGITVPFPQRDVQLATEQPLQVEWTPKNPPTPDKE